MTHSDFKYISLGMSYSGTDEVYRRGIDLDAAGGLELGSERTHFGLDI